jgi:hypothetical protein
MWIHGKFDWFRWNYALMGSTLGFKKGTMYEIECMPTKCLMKCLGRVNCWYSWPKVAFYFIKWYAMWQLVNSWFNIVIWVKLDWFESKFGKFANKHDFGVMCIELCI